MQGEDDDEFFREVEDSASYQVTNVVEEGHLSGSIEIAKLAEVNDGKKTPDTESQQLAKLSSGLIPTQNFQGQSQATLLTMQNEVYKTQSQVGLI